MSTEPAGSENEAIEPFEWPPHVLTETPEEIAFELRAAEGSLWTGTRLVVGIAVFALASLAFAYFYLRSSNNAELWRPGNVTAPVGTGAAIFAITAASGLLAIFGKRRLQKGQRIDWQVAGWTVVLGGLLALGLQIWELTQLSFFPGSSGYASCFIGWASMNIAMLVGATYWIETLLARSLRLRRALLEEGGNLTSPLPAERLFRANVEGCAFFWGFVVVAAAFFWLLFYVI
jgi:heme/copper-type cytochrome/quinol oxidase subunit 3